MSETVVRHHNKEVYPTYDDARANILSYPPVSSDMTYGLFKGLDLTIFKASKFYPADRVYVIRNRDGSSVRHGPYMIEMVVGERKYTLCMDDGTPAVTEGKNTFEKTDMEQAW